MEKYLIPNYFKKFKCKCGDCRNTCCVGWTVTMSVNEYFKIKNLECDEEFREKLDRGIYTCINPTAERYAYIKKNYYGDCVFHDWDGLCEIHKKFGEENIARVCDMYPKSIKGFPYYEKSCGNSCEGVLELIINSNEKLTFDEYPDNPDYSIELKCIDLIQEEKPLFEKFKEIGKIFDYDSYIDICKEELLSMIYEYVLLYKDNNSLDEYVESIEKMFGEDNILKVYDECKNHLYKIVPDYDNYISKIMANHMLFTDFPYEKIGHSNLSFYSLCGVYSFSTFVLTLMMRDKNTITDMVDILSKIFRLVEHSQFPIMVGKYFKSKLINSVHNLIKM